MYYNPLLSSSARVASLLKTIGNDRRLQIVCHLAHGERSVGELCELVGMGQSALSQHLAKLRSEAIVTTRRDAQTIFYSIASDEVLQVLSALQDCLAKPSLVVPGKRRVLGTAT